jgi:cellulose biosynthesis protein BcsQ
LKNDYALDAIVIDTQPSVTPFDSLVFMATDGFVFLTECERLSFAGLATAVSQMRNFSQQRRNYLRRGCELIGIIPNKLDARTVLHRHNVSELGKTYPGKVWTPITWRVAWAEATNVGELVYDWEPDSQAAHDAWMIVDRVEAILWPVALNVTG